MTTREAKALRASMRVQGWGETGVVLVSDPVNHYLLIEWDSDGARSHLDMRDCDSLFRQDRKGCRPYNRAPSAPETANDHGDGSYYSYEASDR